MVTERDAGRVVGHNSGIIKKPPRGCGELVLYLDFDGVLHPNSAILRPKQGVCLDR